MFTKILQKYPRSQLFTIYIVYQVNQDFVGRIALRIIIFDFSDISELDQRDLDLKEATECREDWKRIRIFRMESTVDMKKKYQYVYHNRDGLNRLFGFRYSSIDTHFIFTLHVFEKLMFNYYYS